MGVDRVAPDDLEALLRLRSLLMDGIGDHLRVRPPPDPGRPARGTALGVPDMNWHLAFHTSIAFGTNTDYQHYVGEEQALPVRRPLRAPDADVHSPPPRACASSRRWPAGSPGRTVASATTTSTSSERSPGSWSRSRSSGRSRSSSSASPRRSPRPPHVLPLTGGHQTIPLGPVASWDSIEFLGTNGGGYFAANAAKPVPEPDERPPTSSPSSS